MSENDGGTIIGMALRDFFASQANVKEEYDNLTIGEYRKMLGHDYSNIPNYRAKIIAKLKYRHADAMLKEKEEWEK